MTTNNYSNLGGAFTTKTIIGNVTAVTNVDMRPKPTPEAIVFRVFHKDINFVGRSDELCRMKEEIEKSPYIVVVSGLGGIGKTELIKRFISENRASYKNVIWINSARRELLEESFKTLAKDRMNISLTNGDGSDRDLSSIVQLVYTKLSTISSLIVYDNVDKKELIKFAFTMEILGKNVHAVITSRIQEWSKNVHKINLKVWNPNEAFQYVATTLVNHENKHTDTDDEKMSLAKSLQYFPLALKQATAHINHQRVQGIFQIADYVNKYDTQKMLSSTYFQEDDFNIYEETTFTTWRVTTDAIEQNKKIGQLATRILHIIAYFEPEYIHRDIFCHLYHAKNRFADYVLQLLRCLHLVQDSGEIDYVENVKEAIRLLVNFSMIDSQKEQSIINIHRLVQKVIQIELKKSKDQEQKTLRDGLTIFSKLIEVGNIYESHQHTVSVFLAAVNCEKLVREFSQIPAEILATLLTKGKYRLAKDFGDKILQPLTNILSEDHPDILLTKIRLAQSYKKQGMYSEALKMSEDCFRRRKNALGENHVDTLACKSHIAISYARLGKYSESLQMHQEVFKKLKEVLGDDHPNTLKSQAYIARSYIQLRKYNEAVKIYEELYEKQIKVLGENDLETISCESYRATTYADLGNFTESFKLLQNVFAKRMHALGEDHPDTLLSHSNIAVLYRLLGKYTEALQIEQEVFEKRKTILGEDHPHTLMNQANIAILYSELGNHVEALQLFKKVFDAQKNILGEDHPKLLDFKSYVAISYAELENFTESLKMFEEVYEKRKLRLGENHLDTLISKHHMAFLYIKIGKYSEALQKFEEVFEQRKNALGENHPDTLLCKANIGFSFRHMGKYTEALQIYQELFEKQKDVLEDDHPNILNYKSNIAFSYSHLGKCTEALQLYKEVFEKQRQKLGDRHPDTLESKSQIELLKSNIEI